MIHLSGWIQNGTNLNSWRQLKSHQKLCLPHLEFGSMFGAHALNLIVVPAMRSFMDKVGRGKEKENFPSYTG